MSEDIKCYTIPRGDSAVGQCEVHHQLIAVCENAALRAKLAEVERQHQETADLRAGDKVFYENRLREVEKERDAKANAIEVLRTQLSAAQEVKNMEYARAESLSRELAEAKDNACGSACVKGEARAESLSRENAVLRQGLEDSSVVLARELKRGVARAEALEAQVKAKDEALKEAIDYLDGVTSVNVSAMEIVRRGRAALTPAKPCSPEAPCGTKDCPADAKSEPCPHRAGPGPACDACAPAKVEPCRGRHCAGCHICLRKPESDRGECWPPAEKICCALNLSRGEHARDCPTQEPRP